MAGDWENEHEKFLRVTGAPDLGEPFPGSERESMERRAVERAEKPSDPNEAAATAGSFAVARDGAVTEWATGVAAVPSRSKDLLGWSLHWARRGMCLNATEAKALAEEVDRLRAHLHAERLERARERRRLSTALHTAAVRYEILLGRMAACHSHNPREHTVSLVEVPGWVEETREVAGELAEG